MGYSRSAKKCKEKFENVHKYYKRTKESRAGRNDGKTYRFFSQLEALHAIGSPAAASPSPVTSSFAPPPSTIGIGGPLPVRTPAEPPPPVGSGMPAAMMGNVMSFSTSNTEEYSDEEDDSDDEGTQELAGDERGKRKRGSGSGKMMRFFEGLMRQVMERQEAMQQRFLEAIEKREQDRMIREEAWRRQEMARLAREQEILAQERAMAASRDAAVLSFIQKITGQTVPMPSIAAPAINAMPPPPPSFSPPSSQPPPPPAAAAVSQTPQPQQQQRQPSPQQQKSPQAQQQQQQSSSSTTDMVMTPASLEAENTTPGGGGSSRWPKAEVHALIQLRSNLDTRYQEAGPKGPLWEEISAGMRRMGYSRSAKRCKEKWENINKYFKKVKESNKKRPEDSKTCPYFHQLDALYRNKALITSSSTVHGSPAPPLPQHHQEQAASVTVTAAAPISQTPPPLPPSQLSSQQSSSQQQQQHAAKNGNGNGNASDQQMLQATNGSVVAAAAASKKQVS
ncbi:hypothetical protein PR202_ga07589 [Eleusine coracana subsp. coracana]|uniref:Myb-like domain-containing protein n=1 Tax=Eleusine coracana subsp. coracana TaxID=191504 RepID=A0AAV5BZ08_ELECO|nr:hypothetical protein PR202_ga07589 [Eleusine coracana subsp. coracana]